jgi:outer membrane protein assembly factor BamB
MLAGVDRRGDVYAAWFNHERAVGKLSGRTGDVLWKRSALPEIPIRSMDFGHDAMAIGYHFGRIDMLDAVSGERLWTTTVDVPEYDVRIDRHGGVVFHAWGTGKLGKLAPEGGALLWTHDDCGPFALRGTNDVAAAVIQEGEPLSVWLFDANDGRVRWTKSLPNLIRVDNVAMAANGDVLVLGVAHDDDDLKIIRLSRSRGAVEWRISVNGQRLRGWHLLTDPRGDVLAATAGGAYPGESLMRILKRDGRSGEDYSPARRDAFMNSARSGMP